jgi:arsenate reductase (thioredoxin)
MTNILVLCTGNSCRSQIAHGYLEHLTDGQSVKVYSAGITKHGVNPRAIATMQADGIDISQYTSNNVAEYESIDFDYVITVCDNANENCPVWIGRSKILHHNFPDPPKFKGTETEIIAEFTRVRDMIKAYCQQFVADNGL